MRASFTAFDFETANSQSHSACQLGIAVVDQGIIVEKKSWLIKPPSKLFTFSELHGITYQMVKDQPEFPAVWSEAKRYIEQQIIVAHNVDFDLAVLVETLSFYHLPVPKIYAIDSLETARKAWPNLPNHKLSTVAAHLNLKLNHHDALSDAEVCAQIILRAGFEYIEINRTIQPVIPETIDLFSGGFEQDGTG
jgi:DNA polymerase-3 subunit epsilon